MTLEDRPPESVLREGPRTPDEYFTEGRAWLELAEWEMVDLDVPDRSSDLAILAIASALLGICAQLIQEPEKIGRIG